MTSDSSTLPSPDLPTPFSNAGLECISQQAAAASDHCKKLEAYVGGFVTKLRSQSADKGADDLFTELRSIYSELLLAVENLSKVVKTHCISVPSEHELLTQFRDIACHEWNNLGVALADISKIPPLIKEMRGEFARCMGRLHAKKSEMARLSANLAREPGEWGEVDSLPDALNQEKEILAEISALTLEHEKRLSDAKAVVETHLSELQATYDFASLSQDWNTQMESMVNELKAADSEAGVSTVGAKLVELRQRLSKAPDAQRLESLAATARSSGGVAGPVMRVVHSLIARNRPTEALALLTALQLSRSFEDSGVEDFSEFVVCLCSASFQAASQLPARFWGPALVLAQPWLTSLRRGDVPDKEARQLLALCVLAMCHRSEPSMWATLLFGLESHRDFGGGGSPLLASVFDELVFGQFARIAESDTLREAEQLQSEIRDIYSLQEGTNRYKTKTNPPIQEVEQEVLFPQIRDVAESVMSLCQQRDFDGARRLLEEQNPKKIFEKACARMGRSASDSPYYVRQVIGDHGYLTQLLELLDQYLSVAEGVPVEKQVDKNILLSELDRLFADSPRGLSIGRAVVASVFAPEGAVISQPDELMTGLSFSDPRVMGMASSLVTTIARHPDRVGDLADCATTRRYLLDMLSALPEQQYSTRNVTAFEDEGCLHQAALLTTIIPDMEQQSKGLARKADLEARRLREEVEKRRGAEVKGRPLADVEGWLASFYLPAVEAWLEHQREYERQMKAITEAEKLRKLDAIITELHAHQAQIMNASIASELQDELLDLISKFQRHALMVKRGGPGHVRFNDSMQRLDEWMQGLRFASEYKDERAAAELHQAMEGGLDFPNAVVPVEADGHENDSLSQRDKDRIEDAMASWSVLGKEWELDVLEDVQIAASKAGIGTKIDREGEERIEALRTEIKRLLVSFSSRCRLYSTEGRDFKEQKRIVFEPLGSTSLIVGTTTMRLSRNRYLENFSLFVLPSKRPHGDHLDAVRKWMSDHPNHLNIVLVAGGSANLTKIREHFDGARDMVLGASELQSFLSGPEEDSSRDRIRQFFIRQAYEAAVPFRYDNMVDVEKDLFAGREEEIEKMLAANNFFLCGGRRTGKTSLMHALRRRLMKSGEWKIAFVDCQRYRAIHSNSVGHWDLEAWMRRHQRGAAPLDACDDPDLAVAVGIAAALGFPPPSSIREFEQGMAGMLAAGPVAILLDEIDCYLHASRWYHGDKRLPLMSSLRSLFSDADGRLKIVFAGFKDLFFESNRTDINHVASPFGNWLQYLPVGALPYAVAADDLIREGMCMQMGYRVSVDACQKIHDYASGHPAFIQALCHRLCIAKKRDGSTNLNIDARDVQRVYEDTGDTQHQQSYLGWVDRTLGLNLDPLELAIVLTIAETFREKGEQGTAITRHAIVTELETFCGAAGKDFPDPDHLHWAFMNLKMAGLLEEPTTGCFKFEYRSYFDILARLNRLVRKGGEPSALDVAITEYDKMRYATD